MCPGYREGSVALLQPSAEWNVSDKIRGVLEVFFGCSCRLVLWQTNRPFAMHGLEEAQVLFACCAVAVARRHSVSGVYCFPSHVRLRTVKQREVCFCC